MKTAIKNLGFENTGSFVGLSIRCDTNTSRCNINRFSYLWDKNVGDEIRVDQEIETLVPGHITISDDATCVISEKIEGIDRNGLPIRTIVLIRENVMFVINNIHFDYRYLFHENTITISTDIEFINEGGGQYE